MKSEIHPDYVKYMLDKYQYTIDDVVKVCEIVKGTAPIGFTKKLVDEVIESGFISPQKKRRESTYDVHELKDLVKKNPVRYQNRHKDRDFLILANWRSFRFRAIWRSAGTLVPRIHIAFVVITDIQKIMASFQGS